MEIRDRMGVLINLTERSFVALRDSCRRPSIAKCTFIQQRNQVWTNPNNSYNGIQNLNFFQPSKGLRELRQLFDATVGFVTFKAT